MVYGNWGTIGGGGDNQAGADGREAPYATVGGGRGNDACGTASTVPGGRDNEASGDYSFAAGRKADTNGQDGTVVFGDSTNTSIDAQNENEVRSQMPMYAPAFNTTSARSAKTAVESVDPQTVLAGVEQLAITTWEFADTDGGRHIGPMAAEFRTVFEVGDDDESIATVDADGVALAAIQALSRKLDRAVTRIETLRETLQQSDAVDDPDGDSTARSAEDGDTDQTGRSDDTDDERVAELTATVEELRTENERVRERLRRLEARCSPPEPDRTSGAVDD